MAAATQTVAEWLQQLPAAEPTKATELQMVEGVRQDEPTIPSPQEGLLLHYPLAAYLRQVVDQLLRLVAVHCHLRQKRASTLLRRPSPCRRPCGASPMLPHQAAQQEAARALVILLLEAAGAARIQQVEEAERPRHSMAEAAEGHSAEATEAMQVQLPEVVEAESPNAFASCSEALEVSPAAAEAGQLHLPAAATVQCLQAACLYEPHPKAEEAPFRASCCEDPFLQVPRRRPNRCCPYHRPCSATPQKIAVSTANDGTHPAHILLRARIRFVAASQTTTPRALTTQKTDTSRLPSLGAFREFVAQFSKDRRHIPRSSRHKAPLTQS